MLQIYQPSKLLVEDAEMRKKEEISDYSSQKIRVQKNKIDDASILESYKTESKSRPSLCKLTLTKSWRRATSFCF